MDAESLSRLQRDQELSAGAEDAHNAQMEGRLKELHTSCPGIIASFDPVKQTASVQPAIKRIFTERGAVNLPLCVDVPVQFPRGGAFVLTFPVVVGDECILLFGERAIDNWFTSGGTQEPFEYRMHDLSDGMAIVGISSLGKVVPSFSAANVELRSIDHSTRVALHPDGTIENINPAGSTVLNAAGKFIINAPGGIELNGNTLLKGNMTSQAGNGGTGACNFAGDVIAQNVSVHNHTHGENDSGGPTDPPNPI